MIALVLASASPARRSTLRNAGVDPEVMVSGVDEDAELAQAQARYGELSPADVALTLARAKCEAVVQAQAPDALVLGCDSVLELDGQIYGKPIEPAVAIERWRLMRGQVGILHTGHWIVDNRERIEHPGDTSGGTGATLGATASTTVHFADLTDEEIDAYVATGEPLQVAGAFTVDGLGGPYVTSIDGDYHAVVGVSLPLVRELLLQLDVPWHSLRS
ncbi:MAG: nucleoside triphosphate pyrophosphatase [Ornithinimicrobium sp.]|uniref:Maf family protein n=1 Tax=Ornithinimicrobium sp. TaxID=1977084 RepID=UPI0026DEAF17|nr:nucleoside triphosphate pyrophosphatase [Ornithinimicrobium sp.]MDO5740853.1 nucleoside triphosphate pyrophosphatase [Ornithinimicrobium sp.]